ncbi:MAG TPA: flagellar motor switch protein FliG, partial [Shewanella sp.]|nr:flagellar motor switch protein FliG [Shewanella sp.]
MAENKTKEVAPAAAPAFNIKDISGVEKTAILLLSLSEADAASILKHLEPKQV